MIYLSSFLLSDKKLKNPNIYPYSVFRNKYISPLVFSSITVLYGNNGSGKSTILNLIAEKLGIHGFSRYRYRQTLIDYFLEECSYGMSDDEYGKVQKVPKNSRYIKSEDILYEIKKIQQEEALEQGYIYEQVQRGMTKRAAKKELYSHIGLDTRMDILQFAQEKYSNGETAMQVIFDSLEPDALYLLDEPEVSLSPPNQVKLAEEMNKMARLLGCQFIIATHSPFMLGTLNAKIYNLDSDDIEEEEWSNLENVRYFYEFFKKHEKEF